MLIFPKLIYKLWLSFFPVWPQQDFLSHLLSLQCLVYFYHREVRAGLMSVSFHLSYCLNNDILYWVQVINVNATSAWTSCNSLFLFWKSSPRVVGELEKQRRRRGMSSYGQHSQLRSQLTSSFNLPTCEWLILRCVQSPLSPDRNHMKDPKRTGQLILSWIPELWHIINKVIILLWHLV